MNLNFYEKTIYLNTLYLTSIDKNGQEITKYLSYRLLIIATARFMANSLSNFGKYISKRSHQIKFK